MVGRRFTTAKTAAFFHHQLCEHSDLPVFISPSLQAVSIKPVMISFHDFKKLIQAIFNRCIFDYNSFHLVHFRVVNTVRQRGTVGWRPVFAPRKVSPGMLSPFSNFVLFIINVLYR